MTKHEILFKGKNDAVLFGNLSKNGTLTISGKGEMPDYYREKTPWEDWKQLVNSLVIGEGITGIGGKAFYGCKGIKKVQFPCSLQGIRYGAFEDCCLLEEVKFHENRELRHVYEEKNKEVPFREAVRKKKQITIGSRVFLHTPWAVKKWGDFLMKDNCLLEYYGKHTEIVLPEHIREIGKFAFKNHELTSVTLPQGLKKIGFGAFEKTGLSEITIPKNVELIEDNAFRNIGRMLHVTFETENVKLEGSSFDIPNTVFSGYLGSSARKYALCRGMRFRDIKRNENKKRLAQFVREIPVSRIEDFGKYLENKLKSGYMIYCVDCKEGEKESGQLEVFTGRLKTDDSIPGKIESTAGGKEKIICYHKWNIEEYLGLKEDEECRPQKIFLDWKEGCFKEWMDTVYLKEAGMEDSRKWYISLWEYAEDQIGEYEFIRMWLEEEYDKNPLPHKSQAPSEEESIEEKKKTEALRRIGILKIKRSVQRAFEETGKVYKAADGNLEETGSWEEERIREWEKETGNRVYYVMENFTCLGMLFTMLYVSDNRSRWKGEKEEIKSGCFMAYCINLSNEDLSEYGYISVETIKGAAIRVG